MACEILEELDEEELELCEDCDVLSDEEEFICDAVEEECLTDGELILEECTTNAELCNINNNIETPPACDVLCQTQGEELIECEIGVDELSCTNNCNLTIDEFVCDAIEEECLTDGELILEECTTNAELCEINHDAEPPACDVLCQTQGEELVECEIGVDIISCTTSAEQCQVCDATCEGCQSCNRSCDTCQNCNNGCQNCDSCNNKNSCVSCNRCNMCDNCQSECQFGRQTPLTSGFSISIPSFTDIIISFQEHLKPILDFIQRIKNKYVNDNYNGTLPFQSYTKPNIYTQDYITANGYNSIINILESNSRVSPYTEINGSHFATLWNAAGNYHYSNTLCQGYCNTSCQNIDHCSSCDTCNACVTNCQGCVSCQGCNRCEGCNNSCQDCQTDCQHGCQTCQTPCQTNCQAGCQGSCQSCDMICEQPEEFIIDICDTLCQSDDVIPPCSECIGNEIPLCEIGVDANCDNCNAGCEVTCENCEGCDVSQGGTCQTGLSSCGNCDQCNVNNQEQCESCITLDCSGCDSQNPCGICDTTGGGTCQSCDSCQNNNTPGCMNCDTTCQVTCQSDQDCGTYEMGSCVTTCQVTCQSDQDCGYYEGTGCDTSAGGTCQSGDSGSCGDCQVGCQGGCQTICEGHDSCSGQAF